MSNAPATTTNRVRTDLGSDAGAYVFHFGKIVKELPNGKMVSAVIEADEATSKPERVTLWLGKDDRLPKPKEGIMALVERSKTTDLSNGKEYVNADVRTWTFSD